MQRGRVKTRKTKQAEQDKLHPALVGLARLLARDLARRHTENRLSESPDGAYDSDLTPEDKS